MPASLSPILRSQVLIEALPYIQRFRHQLFVIKFGGSVMDDDDLMQHLLRDIVFLEAVGIRPLIVHGGGKAISQRMKQAGIEPRFIQGLRVTDAATIHWVEEALDGEINPKLVAMIQHLGGHAQGFSGKWVFGATKKASSATGDLGFVGEVKSLQTADLLAVLDTDRVPVISPLGCELGQSGESQVLNINADLAACNLAIELQAEKLIYISDVPGILRKPSDPQTLISHLNAQEVEQLIAQGIISGGMIPKVNSALEALQKGVGKIHFISGNIMHGLLVEIFSDAGIGTELTSRDGL